MKIETSLVAGLLHRYGNDFFAKLPRYATATRIYENGKLLEKLIDYELIKYNKSSLTFLARRTGLFDLEEVSIFDLDNFKN